ncbi:hypothetical protein [Microbulbifer sp. S227A]|uniref:hypothetical protein n=1 Tax=Microbulbifer sp. S227A TaxID=3415131 RepID=UPI003C7BEF52
MIKRPTLLPEYTTPADLAGHFGVAERTLREKLREIGAFAILGKKMVLFPEHVEDLKEAMKCPSHSTDAAKSGTIEGVLPVGDFAGLQARLKKPMQKGSNRKSNSKPGSVVSMGRGRA